MFPPLLPPTHIHPNPLLTLAPHLTPHLPHSLPLLRRLQHNHSSPHARTLATFPPNTSTPSSSPSSSSSSSSYSALWIDRSRGPETECWIFSTHELPPSSPHRNNNADLARGEILALLNAVAELPVPGNRSPPGGGADFVVVGSLRESLVEILGGEELGYLKPQSVLSRDLADLPSNAAKEEEEEGGNGEGNGNREGEMAGRKGVLGGLSTPYMKWIIAPLPPTPTPPPAQEHEQSERELHLPPGYHYSRPRAERGELELVLSRTSIPRSEATLAKLGSVGIRYVDPGGARDRLGEEEEEKKEEKEEKERGQLISWAFLGPDGSLTSLHVEEPHRGQGLAKAVAKRLFKALKEDMGGVGFRAVGGDGGWAHSDVAIENKESAGVARGLGGVEGWVVRWVHVDLGRVRGLVVGGGVDSEGGRSLWR